MLARCVICGKRAAGRCRYCGDTLCAEHLPPEKHWCVAYYDVSSADEDIDMRSEIKSGEISPVISSFNIFSHNFSLLLLIAMSVSFVLQLIYPPYTDLLILKPAYLIERPWTLVTHIFLHSGFEHFFFNMLFLAFFAPVLERAVGNKNFLAVFLISGIAAGAGWCLTTSNPLSGVLGASGALCGVFGALAVLMPRMKIYLFFLIPMEMWLAAILFALYDFLFAFAPVSDHIAHTAHLSGLFIGMLAGEILRRRHHRVMPIY
ncbi:MAG: rhomboid family intramembrane serine protease [Canidatus Methanoxibalbensis ujae]|nr:rhomboid family intramembrane serine protease [Candidatus Methanoxibalbensis ujae]MCW7079122.1 rhomboid family intramembrane serine protease [Candidatus Methanoxibalbensis ujae]